MAIVSGGRGEQLMGLELAELRLLDALRRTAVGAPLDVRVVGGRGARRHSRRVAGRWIPARPGRSRGAAWRNADLVHLIGLDLPPPRYTPFVAMVHDLAAFAYPDEVSPPPWLADIVERARLLLTPSAFTASELQRRFGVDAGRIRVIGGGPALLAHDAAPLTRSELAELRIEPPLVLRYGGYTARKNVPLLLEAWTRVEHGTLVLAGPPQTVRDQVLAAAPSLDRVVVLDYVSPALLARLLRTAAVFASPSAYEGFGLPVLEALAAGTPVVASRTQFAEEICGDAACLADAEPATFAEALERVVRDGTLSDRLRAAGRIRAAAFTWEAAAAEVLAAYVEASTPG